MQFARRENPYVKRMDHAFYRDCRLRLAIWALDFRNAGAFVDIPQGAR